MRGKINTPSELKIVGIDPGLKGAWAEVHFKGKKILGVRFGSFPTFKREVGLVKRSEYDLSGMLRVLNFPDAYEIYLEDVWAFPKDTPMTAFKFGKGVGIIQTCLTVHHGDDCFKAVVPQKWEGIMHLGITKKLTPKKRSEYRISEIFPELLEMTKSDGVYDAFLIAVYGYFKETGVIIR